MGVIKTQEISQMVEKLDKTKPRVHCSDDPNIYATDFLDVISPDKKGPFKEYEKYFGLYGRENGLIEEKDYYTKRDKNQSSVYDDDLVAIVYFDNQWQFIEYNKTSIDLSSLKMESTDIFAKSDEMCVENVES